MSQRAPQGPSAGRFVDAGCLCSIFFLNPFWWVCWGIPRFSVEVSSRFPLDVCRLSPPGPVDLCLLSVWSNHPGLPPAFLVFPESQRLALIVYPLTNPWSSRPRRAPWLPAPPGPPLQAAAPLLCWPRAQGQKSATPPLHSWVVYKPLGVLQRNRTHSMWSRGLREIYSGEEHPSLLAGPGE